MGDIFDNMKGVYSNHNVRGADTIIIK